MHKRYPDGFLVAVRNVEILGYVIVETIINHGFRYLRPKKRGHLMNLSVHQEFRHNRIGTVLVKTIIEYLKEKVSEDVWLEVRSSNSIARIFYSKTWILGERTKKRYYFDEDAIIIKKEF